MPDIPKLMSEVNEESTVTNIRTRYSARMAAALSPARNTTRPPLVPIKESHQREKRRYQRQRNEENIDEDKENNEEMDVEETPKELPQVHIEGTDDESTDDDAYNDNAGSPLTAQGDPQVATAQGNPHPNGSVLIGQPLPTPPGPESPDSGVEQERGVNGPEAHYSVTVSQILEVECLAKARSFDNIDISVIFREIGQERVLTLSHQLFDRLWVAAHNVNNTLGLIRSGFDIRSTIQLGENVCLTMKSNYPVTPIDIRRFDRINGITIPSLEGQVFTPNEWEVFYNLLPTIHLRLTQVELDVKFILRHLQAELAARQN